MPDDAAIAALLQQSRAAHARYRDHSPRMIPNGAGALVLSPGNPSVANAAVLEAAQCLADAQALDEAHTSVAWPQTGFSVPLVDHLLSFYSEQLSR